MAPSIKIKSLPKIDLIVISHSHYDHLDKNSVKNLGKDSSTIWFVPLGLKTWFNDIGIENVFEMDWFEEQKNIKHKHHLFTISALVKEKFVEKF